MSIVTIIVTYNPASSRFKLVLTSAAAQVSYVLVVDNNSDNKDFIRNICNAFDNCEFIELGFNFGVAYALKKGIRYAMIKYNPSWLLFLDQDTVLLNNVLSKILYIFNVIPENIRNKIAIILLGNKNKKCEIKEVRYGIFAGTLIKSEVAFKVCCRDSFFLDQADFDLYSKVRELGYLTVVVDCKLVDHWLGKNYSIPAFSKILQRKTINYEPPWRFYYIVRNSTKLLIEGRMDLVFYVKQLIRWSIPIFYINGPKVFIKMLGLGLSHALLNRLGILC